MSVIDNVLAHFQGNLIGKRITVWGLAKEPDDDGIVGSPALPVIDWLLAAGADVVVHDPSDATQHVRDWYGDLVTYANDKWEASRGADALIVMTRWGQYVGVDPGMLRWYLAAPVVFDYRRCLCRERFAYGDIAYYVIEEHEEHEERKAPSLHPGIYSIDNYRNRAFQFQSS